MTPADSGQPATRGLRSQLRAARRSIQGSDRTAAEAQIVRAISQLSVFRRAQKIASYHAFDGEPNLATLYDKQPKGRYFVPVITSRGMRFAVDHSSPQARKNQFGIREPLRPSYFPSIDLDLVLTPLVGFDNQGARIGMGRAYYDRCFSYLLGRQTWRRPRLLGVAFECQRVSAITTNPWDVPLWGIATESGVRIF